jgi:hypothetical protein
VTDFPDYDSKRVNVCLFVILGSCYDLGSHPLEGSDLISHVVSLGSGPAEVPKFSSERRIDQNVQRLQISVNNWRVRLVKIIHSSRDVKHDLKLHLDLKSRLGLEQRKQRFVCTELQNDRVVWSL